VGQSWPRKEGQACQDLENHTLALMGTSRRRFSAGENLGELYIWEDDAGCTLQGLAGCRKISVGRRHSSIIVAGKPVLVFPPYG
jgi:hypothetical protein